MTNKVTINAKFIPGSKATPLPELFALRARAKEELAELNSQKKSLRSTLAKKIFLIRKKAKHLGRKHGAREEKLAITLKAIEVDLKSKQILAESYRQGLETIRNICISVFGLCPETQNKLLEARLSQSLLNNASSGLSKILVAKGFKSSLQSITAGTAYIEESSEVTDGMAILVSRSGRIEINVMEDLKEAFSVLEKKLQYSLEAKAT